MGAVAGVISYWVLYGDTRDLMTDMMFARGGRAVLAFLSLGIGKRGFNGVRKGFKLNLTEFTCGNKLNDINRAVNMIVKG